MPRDRERVVDPSPDSAGLWISTLTFACLLSTAYLAVLVIRHQPLPMVDLATAGIVAVGFSLACILALIFILRLPIYSFPVVYSTGVLLVSLAAFMIYPIDKEIAFSGFLVLHEDGLSRGLPVVMLAFASLTLGAALARSKRQPPTPAATADCDWKVESTHGVALALYGLFFTILILLSLRGPGIITAITSGYSGGEGISDLRKAGELPAIFTTSLQWFLPWLSVILLATSRNKKQFARATFLAAIACGLTLLIGKRTVAVIVIALLMQIRYLRGYPLRWRRIAVLGALAGIVILTWPTIRNIPVKDWRPTAIMEALQTRHIVGDMEEEQSSTVRKVLGGFAPGYQPIMVSCHYVPEIEPYRMGFDYFRSVVVAVPFASRTVGAYLKLDETPDVWMMNKIDPGFWTARAFNQIGEAYLQGGAVSVIALYLLLGWYMAWMWRRLRGETDLRMVAFHSLAMFAAYKWIRLESGAVGRTILWAVILIYVLPAVYRWFHQRLAGSPPAGRTLPAAAESPYAGEPSN